MGGQVLFAVNLVAFPDNLGSEVLREILRGGAEKVAEAGAVVVGGHSVNDKEPKYGMAVTGIVHPQQIKTKGSARPGEKILLTKSLGVGVITTALKQQQASAADVAAAVASMKQLNKEAATAAQIDSASAVTDVTGFGLLGHAHEMASQANVNLRFQLNQLPWLPGALGYGEQGTFPGGMGNNMRFFEQHVRFSSDVSDLMQKMLFTPETSGGLLVCVSPENVSTYLAACPTAVVVGDVIEGAGLVLVD